MEQNSKSNVNNQQNANLDDTILSSIKTHTSIKTKIKSVIIPEFVNLIFFNCYKPMIERVLVNFYKYYYVVNV